MTEKKLSTLVINQVESIDVYNLLKTQGKINQDELYLISGEADAITGVKGNKETTYRTGNVNLTPADIGALPDTTEIPVVPTNIGAFDNDVGYLTQHQSLTDYPKKTELANVATSGDYTDLINTPTIPSTEGLATETYVQNKIAEVVNSAPGTLDTLNELAQALGNDPNFATTMATELGKKANTANLATVATSGSYNDLSDTPTIPSVGNGTLTIQKNGTSAGTFTANATTNKTINIIVPTKVSELTDDVVKGKYLSLTGGTMTGNININNKTITNLKTPTADTEAANKKYVDDQIAANSSQNADSMATEIQNHIADTNIHITADERTKWNAAATMPSGAYVGSYTGDGSLNKTLTFNFKPAVVMIAGDPDGPSSAIGIYGFKYLMNDRNSSTVSWTNNSFTITLNQYSRTAYNSNNVTYYYIAIPAMN